MAKKKLNEMSSHELAAHCDALESRLTGLKELELRHFEVVAQNDALLRVCRGLAYVAESMTGEDYDRGLKQVVQKAQQLLLEHKMSLGSRTASQL